MIYPHLFDQNVDIYSCHLNASTERTDCSKPKPGNDFLIFELSMAASDMVAFFQNHLDGWDCQIGRDFEI